MKSLIFIDTETNCFADEIGVNTYDRPFINNEGKVNYPRICQISWIVTSTSGEVLVERDFIIKPKDFLILPSAEGVHGISTEYALEHGYPIEDILEILKLDIDTYNCYKIIGHNVKFDAHMIEGEALRLRDFSFFEELTNFHYEDTCTNSLVMRYVGGLDKRGRIKKPRLSELYIKLFGHSFDGAHNSLNDIRATKDCFFECVKLGLIDQYIFD